MQPSERSDLKIDRRRLMQGTAGVVAAAAAPARPAAAAEREPEWRNRKEGMAYRRLGRTGLMISEIVCGGDPITLENYRHLETALEMGLNYLDMAPQYNRGDTERAYGRLIGAAPGRRDQVFLATKCSGYAEVRERMYRDIWNGLPEDRKQAVMKRSRELRAERGVEQPGYFLTYYPNQLRQFDGAYLHVAMREDYGHQVEGSSEFRRYIISSLEESLKRVGTDHFDIFMCPHGAATPEDVRHPDIPETFQEMKRQGKVRFLGVTSHNDPAGVLREATACGYYDVVMMAYNLVNGGRLEEPIRQAAAAGIGMIAMKTAHAVATHHTSLQPVPEWRIEMIHQIIPGEMKAPLKAYLWSLQNPHISAVISNLWDETYVRENLALAGRKVELRPA